MENDATQALVKRLNAPHYWMSSSDEIHEGENDAPREAAAKITELSAKCDAVMKDRALIIAERDDLAKVIDDTESHYGLSSNGNMWRFWSDKAREIAGELKAERARAEAAEAALADPRRAAAGVK